MIADESELEETSRRPILISFADDKFASARDRFKMEAIFSRFFSEVQIFTPLDLPTELREFCERSQRHRGYGYYLWKPYLVHKAASKPEHHRKIIFWVDAGCWINRFGLTTYVKYLQAMSEEKPFVVFSRGDYKEIQCVKRDVFHHLEAERFLHTPPFMAGVFGFRVNHIARNVLERWYSECSKNVRLIDESPSRVGPEYPGFEVNRNDQGVLSLLLKKLGCYTAFPGEHILPEMNGSYLDMKEYPIVAMRDLRQA